MPIHWSLVSKKYSIQLTKITPKSGVFMYTSKFIILTTVDFSLKLRCQTPKATIQRPHIGPSIRRRA